MGKQWILAAALSLVSSMAFAEHAVPLEPETTGAAPPAVASEGNTTAPTVVTPAPTAVAPEIATSPAAAPAPEPARQAQPSYPPELDVYLVPAAMREVCTIGDWGFDEIRRDCRTEPIPVRRKDPALRGVCVTRYGQRSCY